MKTNDPEAAASAEEDRALVERAQNGDRSAIASLFSRFWRAARAAALGVTGDWAAAEDAASEGFRQALMSLSSLENPDRFAAWLRTIVIRQARSAMLQKRPGASVHEAELAGQLRDPHEHPGETFARRQLADLVQQALQQLPPPLRETIALHYFEGYAPAAAARFLGIPDGTFRRRLHDGHAQLRRIVEKLIHDRSSSHMNNEEQSLARLKTMLGRDEDVPQALRETLALRPTPPELLNLIRDRLTHPAGPADLIRAAAAQVSGAGPSDPAIVARIRHALPGFEEWNLDTGEAAARFFAPGHHSYQSRVRSILPPGFAEGRPGAFLRTTRAILHPNQEIRITNALDLTWMVASPLELHSVQETLERLCATVFPGAPLRFSSFDAAEPRFRSALQLHFEGVPERAALGGVLTEWPGCPAGVGAASVRLFLEPWAIVAERTTRQ